MKIAFLSLNKEQLPHPVIPLGLYYMMGATPKDHQKELWDLCFVNDHTSYLEEKLKNFKPDLIAIGMRNIQNNDYTSIDTNLEFAREIIQHIKSISSSPIVLGGSGFSVLPKLLMEELKADFGIVREGEASFQQLVSNLSQGSDSYQNISNLYFYKDNQLLFSGYNPKFLDIENISPFKSNYGKEYYKYTGIDSVQTKRGCPFLCDYCTYPQIEGRNYRLRNPKNVALEMKEALHNNPEIKHFFIVDSVFNHPKNHAMEVCQQIIDQNINCPWTCYITPKMFDIELALKMKEAGCKGVELGTDSGINSVLNDLKKGFTTLDIQIATEICQEVGLLDCQTFVLGTQTEVLADVKKSMEFLADIKPHSAILMVWQDDRESIEKYTDESRVKLKKDICDYLEVICKEHPNWIVPELGINFNPKMLNYFREIGIKGPLWQQL